MAISSSTFIENIVLFIRNYIKTNVTDPISRTNGIGFVMTSYPKRKVQYPIITIKMTNLVTTKLGMQSEVHNAAVTIEVRVWARNSKESDELTSNVIDVLRDAQYDAVGTDNEDIYGFMISSAVPIIEAKGGGGDNLIHSKVLTLEYRAILS